MRYKPKASNVSRKRAEEAICMYARAESAAPWPLCRYSIVLSTRASIAAKLPLLRAEIPEKREEQAPACVTAQRIQSLAFCRVHGRCEATMIQPLAQPERESGTAAGRA
jgi:hypothetical protein